MYIDADGHGEEGIPLSGMDAHIMKMVIVEDPVVYPFAGSAVIVDLLIFSRSSRHRSIEADVPFRLGIDTAAIGGLGAFLFTGTGICFATGKWAAPFARMLLFTVAPVDHAETGHAQGCAIMVNGDGVGDGIRPAPVRVEVDKRADIPFLAEFVSSIVVMCRVQTDVLDRDVRVNGFKFP